MARMIPAAERVKRARALIQKARELPPPVSRMFLDLSYVAQVKDIFRQARDLIKFIPLSPSASAEMKAEVAALNDEINQTEEELLHPQA